MSTPRDGGSDERRSGRTTHALVALALVAALAALVLFASTMVGPSPPRDVTFVDGWDGDPTCHGPTYSTGDVAYAACDWVYRRRALVRFDPVAATATAVHRWERDDGNLPRLHFVRTCGDDLLFVIGETTGAHLVRLAGDRVTTHDVELADWFNLLGVACDQERIELFTRESHGSYAIRVVSGNGGPEVERVITRAEVPGYVTSAWPAEDGWGLLVRGLRGEAMVGQLDGAFQALAPNGDCAWCASRISQSVWSSGAASPTS